MRQKRFFYLVGRTVAECPWLLSWTSPIVCESESGIVWCCVVSRQGLSFFVLSKCNTTLTFILFCAFGGSLFASSKMDTPKLHMSAGKPCFCRLIISGGILKKGKRKFKTKKKRGEERRGDIFFFFHLLTNKVIQALKALSAKFRCKGQNQLWKKREKIICEQNYSGQRKVNASGWHVESHTIPQYTLRLCTGVGERRGKERRRRSTEISYT